jgi:hypothetical protein
MARVRKKDTKPERAVRRLLYREEAHYDQSSQANKIQDPLGSIECSRLWHSATQEEILSGGTSQRR